MFDTFSLADFTPTFDSAEQPKRRVIVLVDFDRTINSFESGYNGPSNLPDPPMPGAIEALCCWLNDDRFQVKLYTARCSQDNEESRTAADAIWHWLLANGVPVELLSFLIIMAPSYKPTFDIFIDDKGWSVAGGAALPTNEDIIAFAQASAAERHANQHPMHKFETSKGLITSQSLVDAGKLGPLQGLASGINEPKDERALSRALKADGEPIGYTEWRGLKIAIENDGGSIRHPNDEYPTLIPLNMMYGFFVGITGEDGDSLDVILCADAPPTDGPEMVFLCAQCSPVTGEFVQHKVMLGFEDMAHAEAAFKLLWPAKMFAGVFSVPAENFVQIVLPKLDVTKRFGQKPFGMPSGKDGWLPFLRARIPEHKIYVEPYAGSASLFWAKDASETEVLSDTNKEIVKFLRFVQNATDEDISWMRAQKWAPDESLFKSLKADAAERDSLQEAYRFKYLNLHSSDKRGTSFLAGERKSGREFVRNLDRYRDRLKNVTLLDSDALAVMREYDGPDTFFYVDPPWKTAGATLDVGPIEACVRALKGKTLVSYQGSLKLSHNWVEEKVHPIGAYASRRPPQSLFANYKTAAATLTAKSETETKYVTILKSDVEQRLMTGVVLEPDEVDAQRETLTEAIIQKAAHAFLANFQRADDGSQLGMMHMQFERPLEGGEERGVRYVDSVGVVLCESWIAPQDLMINDQPVKKGTWLMTVKAVSDLVWARVKRGDLTGFSIGGFASIFDPQMD